MLCTFFLAHNEDQKGNIMNNKFILGVTLSLILTSFTPALFAEKSASNIEEVKKVSIEKETEEIKIEGNVNMESNNDSEIEKEKDNTTIEINILEFDTSIGSKTPTMLDYDFKGVQSLRGDNALNNASLAAENKNLPADRLPILRNYFQQPPLIPHRVREYKITAQHNKCMTCHSWNNYKRAKATKISQTHFADRDGNAQSNVAARRYFCNQCHVPQVDAKPLVENAFKPVDSLK
jgi:cytochrome c-type protein NapB